MTALGEVPGDIFPDVGSIQKSRPAKRFAGENPALSVKAKVYARLTPRGMWRNPTAPYRLIGR
jgi:hypothetical protein